MSFAAFRRTTVKRQPKRLAGVLLGGLLWIAATHLAGADWPQWRGPERNGISREALSLAAWPENAPPRLAWEASIGKGHSTPAISQGRVFILGWDGTQDTVYCLAEDTGKLLWKQSYPCKTVVQWPGPRATPTAAGELVLTLGQHGQLRAWRTATGELAWQKQLPAECQPDDDYGFAWSPLVVEGLVILPVGQGGMAVQFRDGREAWATGPGRSACVSPVPWPAGNRQGVLLVLTHPSRNHVSLAGVDAATGKELWPRVNWPEKWGAICTDPIVHEGSVFITSAEQYKQGARYSWRNGQWVEDWRNNRLSAYTSGIVLWKNHLFGVDKTGLLKCLDWATGAESWSQRGFGERGSLTMAGGFLLVQTGHTGELVLAEADAQSYRERRRHKVFPTDPATYTAPVYANGRLYTRSYAGRLAVWDLRPKAP